MERPVANLTLAVDRELLYQARKYALDRRTTVNTLVRDFLTSLVREDRRRRAATERWKTLLADGGVDVGPISWKREDLHER